MFEREGVGKMSNGPDDTFLQHDFHDIEAKCGWRSPQLSQVFECGNRQTTSFLPVHGGSGSGPPFAGSRFDLHKGEAAAVTEDKIDLAAASGEVGRQILEPLRSQISFGGSFSQ